MGDTLFDVGSHQIAHHRHFIGPSLLIGFRYDVLVQMRIQDFHHQAMDSTANGGDLDQYLATVGVGIQRFFECAHLSADAANPAQELLLVSGYVRHGIGSYTLWGYI
jgi:hypothetical protein